MRICIIVRCFVKNMYTRDVSGTRLQRYVIDKIKKLLIDKIKPVH